MFALAGAVAATCIPAVAVDPAAAYCESRGGRIVADTATNGARTMSCVFPDGTRVNASAYFRSPHRTTR